MKNFGNRLGYRNNNFNANNNTNNDFIVDARQVLTAKRNVSFNNNNNNNKLESKQIAPKFNSNPNRIQNRLNIDFTIPQKTVTNELYNQEKNSNLTFPMKSNSRISISTNKFSGKNFTDVHASQGIFSNAYHAFASNQKSSYIQPIITSPLKRQSNFKVPDEKIDQKRKRDSSVENMKFTVVNSKPIVENKKPALSTAKFSKQSTQTSDVTSLVSPIQGYRIEIKNLHPQVNVDDVYELFTSLKGELRSCNLIRPGYAEVVFRKLADAERSIDEFHGRELDGKPMNLKLVTASVQSISNEISNDEIKAKILKIQANRKPAHNIQINKDVVFRSMYAKSTAETSKINKKPFKFSVTL